MNGRRSFSRTSRADASVYYMGSRKSGYRRRLVAEGAHPDCGCGICRVLYHCHDHRQYRARRGMRRFR